MLDKHHQIIDNGGIGGDSIEVYAIGGKGAGWAYHTYKIVFDNHLPYTLFHFQEGAIQENGVNGITIESLLAVCKHRLECFQSGGYSCPENDVALSAINLAIKSLNDRTLERVSRRVEDKTQK